MNSPAQAAFVPGKTISDMSIDDSPLPVNQAIFVQNERGNDDIGVDNSPFPKNLRVESVFIDQQTIVVTPDKVSF